MNSATRVLTNSLQCGGNATFGTSSLLGAPSATTGKILNINNATFTDTATAASSSVASFSGIYFAQPTLTAANTNVRTTQAATLTLADAPSVGTGQSIQSPQTLNVASGQSIFRGNLTMTGTLPLLYANQPYGTFTMSMTATADGPIQSQYTYNSGNIGTGVTTSSNGIPITITGIYMITHAFEATNVIEYVLYNNTSAAGNRLINRYDNGSVFASTRHNYTVIASLQAGATIGTYITVNATTSINTTAKGLVITLIARTA